jgi:Zn-dependent protease
MLRRLRILRVGTVRGIAVQIHFSWWLGAALLSHTLGAELFPEILPEMAWRVSMALGFTGTILFFCCLFLHELGHCVVSQKCGIPVRAITLSCIGGVAEITREPDTPQSEIRIALGGPAVSLALGLTLFGASLMLQLRGWPQGAVLSAWLGWANASILVFNLLPGYPLDGGRVLRALLWARSGNLAMATRITRSLGSALGWATASLGAYFLVIHGDKGGAGPILVGIFLQHTARRTPLPLPPHGASPEAFDPGLAWPFSKKRVLHRSKNCNFPGLALTTHHMHRAPAQTTRITDFLRRNRLRLILLALGGAVLVALPFLLMLGSVGWDVARERLARRSFDSVEWKASLSDGENTTPVRLRMVDDLLRHHRLEGMERADVLSLLGVPPSTGYFREYDLVYWLGPERSFFSIDSEWLGIRLDPSGRVAAAQILRD